MLNRLQFKRAPKYAGHQLFNPAAVPTETRAHDLLWERSDLGWAAARNARTTSRDIPWARANESYITRQQTLFNPAQFGRPEESDTELRTRQQLFHQRWGE